MIVVVKELIGRDSVKGEFPTPSLGGIRVRLKRSPCGSPRKHQLPGVGQGGALPIRFRVQSDYRKKGVKSNPAFCLGPTIKKTNSGSALEHS